MLNVLGDILEPYSERLGQIAGFITILQFLSSLALLNDIRKRGKSDAYPPDMFLGGFILTVLSLKIGLLMNDSAMINVNIFGFVINVVFLGIFYYYASQKYRTKIWFKSGVTAAIIGVILAYAEWEDPEEIAFRLGMMLTVILVCLVGLPLLNLNNIIKNKSTEGLPFPMILSGTLVASSWAIYGISIRNSVMVYQNLFLVLLSSIQLSLFAIYPNTNRLSETKAAKTEANKKKD